MLRWRNVGEVSGEATAATVTVLKNSLTLEQVRLPFHYAEGKLVFTKFDGMLGGGALQWRFGAGNQRARICRSTCNSRLEKVDLGRAITDPAWQIHGGQLRGALELHGASHDTAQRRTGRGEIHVTEASVDVIEPLLRPRW